MTSFKGTPLFGKDSSPKRTSSIMSAIGTFVFWILFFIMSVIIKLPENSPKYKEVQIVLEPLPVPVEKQKEEPAPSEQASPAEQNQVKEESKTVSEPKVIPNPAAPKKAVEPKKPAPAKQTPAKQAQPKTETAKKSPAPAKQAPSSAEPVEYAVDPMDAFANQTTKKPKKEIDWSMFGETSSTESSLSSESKSQPVKNKPLESSFSGSAATAAETSSLQKQTSESSSQTSKQTEVTESTTSKLGKISSTTYSGRAIVGVQSESKVKTSVSGSGKVVLEMTDGTKRALLDPEKPVINLSEEAANTIDSSKNVSIQFKIIESGNIPRGEISITPAAALPKIVRDEITEQISKWRFEASEYISTARFEYNIVKK